MDCYKKLISLSFLALTVQCSWGQYPLSFTEFLKQSTFNGNLRSYYFTRNFGRHDLKEQNAFSLGGKLNIETASFNGWNVIATYYAADPLGLNSDDFRRLDATLPGKTVNTLGQSYLQFQNPRIVAKFGNQLMQSPWLNSIDSRMIPATYQAMYAALTPIPQFTFTVFRAIKFKSRTAKEFDRSNLYEPEDFGGTPLLKLNDFKTLGTLAVGAAYQAPVLKTQIWFYKFYDFANLAYADVNYTYREFSYFHPFIGAQFAGEGNEGKNELRIHGYGKPDANVYGSLIGVEIPNGQLQLGYNYIPSRLNTFHNGGIVSPYTTGYVTDPLYTSSMIAGLIEKGSGNAFKLSGNYFLCDKQLNLLASYAIYHTSPFTPNSSEFNFDITYAFNRTFLKGLSIRDRVGVLNGNPALGRFLYNRIMLEYAF